MSSDTFFGFQTPTCSGAVTYEYVGPDVFVDHLICSTASPCFIDVVVSDAGPASIDSVQFSIDHTWDSDLTVHLKSPAGTRLSLVAGQGSSGDNFRGTTFRDDAAQSVTQGSAPFSGTYRPQGPNGLATFGQDFTGTWQLEVVDTAGGDNGLVTEFRITFCPLPPSLTPSPTPSP
eukprot:CAMPEP_0206250606 /NCGR_PEP_ID=MMETSP0047_2-20121206/21570_1 /ASSEMBLY_ACC=CAM_ASM_000192 /TAXON_ID=195065 /ORGANISM="Chroomonas mesostigmatica_cf, Strain CCMP1168" /LENGTH=174 /DNA_ID=CAMNT_0053676483 /DNA_START=246 /DNA_END=767 /DNA_ORIENTATION=+